MGAPNKGAGKAGGKGGSQPFQGRGKGDERGGGRGGRGGGSSVPLGAGGGKGSGGGKGKGKGDGGVASSRTHQRQERGEAFEEKITFAGRRDDFLVANDTFVPATIYEMLPEAASLVEGVILHGMRVEADRGKNSKWRAVRIDGIEVPPPTARGGRDGRQQRLQRGDRGGGGGSGSATAGEPFEEIISYAGRAEQFVVTRQTFVLSHLFAAWKPVYEGDTLIGRRVVNTTGSSKYKAVYISAVKRASGPALSPHDAWLERSRMLLAQVDGGKSAADETPTGSGEAPVSDAAAAAAPSDEAPSGAAPTPEATARAQAEALLLIDLAEKEWEELQHGGGGDQAQKAQKAGPREAPEPPGQPVVAAAFDY